MQSNMFTYCECLSLTSYFLWMTLNCIIVYRISHGSVATLLTCGGINVPQWNISIVQYLVLLWQQVGGLFRVGILFSVLSNPYKICHVVGLGYAFSTFWSVEQHCCITILYFVKTTSSYRCLFFFRWNVLVMSPRVERKDEAQFIVISIIRLWLISNY